MINAQKHRQPRDLSSDVVRPKSGCFELCAYQQTSMRSLIWVCTPPKCYFEFVGLNKNEKLGLGGGVPKQALAWREIWANRITPAIMHNNTNVSAPSYQLLWPRMDSNLVYRYILKSKLKLHVTIHLASKNSKSNSCFVTENGSPEKNIHKWVPFTLLTRTRPPFGTLVGVHRSAVHVETRYQILNKISK